MTEKYIVTIRSILLGILVVLSLTVAVVLPTEGGRESEGSARSRSCLQGCLLSFFSQKKRVRPRRVSGYNQGVKTS